MFWISLSERIPGIGTSPYLLPQYRKQDVVQQLSAAGFDVRSAGVVKDEADLLAGLGRAFKFPGYYGHNWDAFADCMGDLEDAPGYRAAVVEDCSEFVAKDIRGFVRSMHYIMQAVEGLQYTASNQLQVEVVLFGDF